MTLIELADRLEAAVGPDRELDHAIALCAFGRRVGVSKFTASLDSAMTLVPETAGFTLQQLGMPCMAEVCLPGSEGKIGIGDTPALALCAAALRARAAQLS